ncbi:cyclic lactone autoinducer peptide [Cohnella herbarum]|uniref:Cyclic lactone autoinducer peptide n=1 Tax=Cohnella herbarum TaxID=2728023 RepID=A0A7Z2VN23_9BACL|nr:cyclic lactone autoinducer peptide [Cohnella herbarum]QJD85934.1 cyclic lactone autoinducer peptide [Cohnella herbarum]
MRKKSLHLVTTLLAALASVFVLTACFIWAHQPKVPQELLKRS